MRKLLSVLTALLILLSITGVSAENVMEATVSLTLDSDIISSLVQSMSGMADEEEMAVISAILGLVNKSSAVITASGTDIAYSIRLNDKEAANLLISTSESGIILTSSLFPGYALAVDPEFLMELGGSMGLELPKLDLTKLAVLLTLYGQDIDLALKKIMADAKTEEGTFTPTGITVYTQYKTIDITTHTLLMPIRNLLARLQQDQEMLQILEPFLKVAEEGVDLAGEITDTLSQIDMMLEQEPFALAELRMYTNKFASLIRLESANLEDIAFLLTLETSAGQGGSSSHMNLIATEGPVEDWDVTAGNIRIGQSTDGFVLDGALDTRAVAHGAQTDGTLQILGGGLNANLSLNSFAPTDINKLKVTKIGLGLGDATPLAVLQFITRPLPGSVLAEPTGKTIITVHEGMSEKDFIPLLTEVIGIGLPRILTVITEQAPEVMNMLLEMVLSKASESSAVPEWSIPESDSTANPEASIPVQEATETTESSVSIQETEGPGKLTVEQASLHVTPYSSYYQGTVYTRLVNSGTTPVEFEGGTLELLDVSGNIIGTGDLYECYPEVLEPGETGYLFKGIPVEAASEPSYIAAYNLTVRGREEISKDVTRLPSSGNYGEIAEAYWTNYYLWAEVENESDEPVYDAGIVFALKDESGNLLYITQSSLYGVGIMPHASVSYRTSLYPDTLDYFKANSLVPAAVDTIAYTSAYK